MSLPGHFLADVPPEAELTPNLLHDACAALKRNRDRNLARRSTADMIQLLVSVARDWLNPEFPLRKLALEPGRTVFPPATIARGLDTFFGGVTRPALHDLIEQDLGGAERLDEFQSCASLAGPPRWAIATGPDLILQFSTEIVPTTVWSAMVLGLLARSAQFIRCEPGRGWLPRLFAHSIHAADPQAGACLEVAEWRGSYHLDDALFENGDCVIASGGDRFLSSVRLRAPETARFIACRRGVSLGYVSAEMLSKRHGLQEVAAGAAADVAAWNQCGVFAPHVIYVQEGGVLGGEQFAGILAEELARREQAEPRGGIPAEAAAEIQLRRSVYAARARECEAARASESPRRGALDASPAEVEATRCWNSADSDAWSVVYEAEPRFQHSCLNRFVYVKPVAQLSEALQAAGRLRGNIAAVGLAAPDNKVRELARELARWGVQRVCPLGEMQAPPLAARHGARPSLADLVTWTECESRRSAPGAEGTKGEA